MASFNRVILIGNLTRDVDLKATQSGTAVADVGLAVNDRVKNAQGEWVNKPVFVDVTLWGKTAETAAQYLGKGAPVLIEGRLRLDSWEHGGQQRSKLRVTAERMQMLGGRTTQAVEAPDDPATIVNTVAQLGEQRHSVAVAIGPTFDDEVPF